MNISQVVEWGSTSGRAENQVFSSGSSGTLHAIELGFVRGVSQQGFTQPPQSTAVADGTRGS